MSLFMRRRDELSFHLKATINTWAESERRGLSRIKECRRVDDDVFVLPRIAGTPQPVLRSAMNSGGCFRSSIETEEEEKEE